MNDRTAKNVDAQDVQDFIAPLLYHEERRWELQKIIKGEASLVLNGDATRLAIVEWAKVPPHDRAALRMREVDITKHVMEEGVRHADQAELENLTDDFIQKAQLWGQDACERALEQPKSILLANVPAPVCLEALPMDHPGVAMRGDVTSKNERTGTVSFIDERNQERSLHKRFFDSEATFHRIGIGDQIQIAFKPGNKAAVTILHSQQRMASERAHSNEAPGQFHIDAGAASVKLPGAVHGAPRRSGVR